MQSAKELVVVFDEWPTASLAVHHPLRDLSTFRPCSRHQADTKDCTEREPTRVRQCGVKLMDTTTLLLIIIVLLVIGGGGFYGRGRWY
jgi:hypothetical protein